MCEELDVERVISGTGDEVKRNSESSEPWRWSWCLVCRSGQGRIFRCTKARSIIEYISLCVCVSMYTEIYVSKLVSKLDELPYN